MATLRVRIRPFARYAELLDTEVVDIELTAPAVVADAVARLRENVDGGHLIPEHPLVALNEEHVLSDRPLADGDEIALLPPLAGG